LHWQRGHKQIGLNHPGEILLEEFMKPMGIINMHRLAEKISVSATRIAEICSGQTGLSADIAISQAWLQP